MRRPLEGRRILVTRPGPAGAELALMLEGLGSETRHLPVFEIQRLDPPADLAAEAAAAHGLLITSKKGLEALLASLPEVDRGLVAHCVGEATAAAARSAGFPPGSVSSRGGLEDLVARMLAEVELAGLRLLWPASALSDPAPAEPLAAAGAEIRLVPLYEPRSILEPADLEQAVGFEVFVFASPSALEAFLGAAASAQRARLLENGIAIAIGATTARALEAAGWRRIHVARKPDNEGLLAACLEYL